jgi:translocation and assembly module TamB
MLFKDRTFQIQSANATFDNPTVINPAFSMAANADVSGTKIQMYINGHLDSWKLDLSSNPQMPESEILSLLALGYTSGDTKRMSTTDRSVYEQSEAASLLLHSLDFNREVQNKTGLQIQLDESVTPQQQGTSIFKPTTGAESIAQPKIVIRRQIGKRFDLSYGTTVGGTSSSAEKEVNAEYHFTPGFSVLGVWDNYETIDTQERTSIGMDLKFQTRFK